MHIERAVSNSGVTPRIRGLFWSVGEPSKEDDTFPGEDDTLPVTKQEHPYTHIGLKNIYTYDIIYILYIHISISLYKSYVYTRGTGVMKTTVVVYT